MWNWTFFCTYESMNFESENSNDWEVFKKRGMRFIRMNVNSFLTKTGEVRYIANITNAFIFGISKTETNYFVK